MFFFPLLALSLISASSAGIGPTADITLVNAVVSPDGFSRSAVTANGITPGPIVTANKGDEFNLNVINALTDHTMLLSSSIHWHGFFQKNTSWADGPSFVSQCPIAANDSFLYTFRTGGQVCRDLTSYMFEVEAHELGWHVLVNLVSRKQALYTNSPTPPYRYHSHLSTQYCDGLRGAMVVYDPNDPHISLYDVDNDATVITLADWYHAPVHDLGVIPTLISTLINGLGRYAGGPTSQLAFITVTQGLRYRFRLVSLSCDPNFIFTIDGHTFTIIEVDGVNTQPLTVDSIQIYAGQRYSFVLKANASISNYWIRTVANGGTPGFDNGINSAILRYVGAPICDPTTTATTSVNPLVETNLHPLVATPVPGTHAVGATNVALNLAITFNFYNVQVRREWGGGSPPFCLYQRNLFRTDCTAFHQEFIPPTAPVLLQILSGAHTAAELLPPGSIYTLPPNSVIEISIPGGTPGAPHPFHLHGHNFWVVRSAGSTKYNWDNPVVRDVVSTGPSTSDNTTIRFVTDNAGPYVGSIVVPI
ncbi:Laccase A [Mycena venus]|uniref:laccase n=1 Tax=Mycena venus TaxID=2733690 RepID=A0A8H7CQ12_9AGAR|nr:Laccase A [Mycena venus]